MNINFSGVCDGPLWFNAVCVAVSVLLGAVCYRWLCAERKKSWQQERNESFSARVAQQKNRVRTFLGYPMGWYKVAQLSSLRPGEIKSVRVCGKDAIVFRPSDATKNDKRVYVLDAYCPHLGAHMGDGEVCGDCIECPFHGWLFKGESGACTSIPYSPVPPPKEAELKKWETRVLHGMVLVWYHAEGAAPVWEPQRMEFLDSPDWVYMGEASGRVSMHIQDFAENAADYAHFSKIHGVVLRLPLLGTVLGVKHNTSWELVEEKDKKHQSLFKNHAMLTFFGIPLPKTAAPAEIRMDGGACVMHFHFTTPSGDVHIIQTSTPLAPCLNEYSMVMFRARRTPWLMGKYICGTWLRQAQNDFIIWENKEYTQQPVLVKGDGPIMQLRRWYQQFYTESSNTNGALAHQDLAW